MPNKRYLIGTTDFGYRTELEVTRHLQGIYDLLANGRNVKVTLTQDDGSILHYELPN